MFSFIVRKRQDYEWGTAVHFASIKQVKKEGSMILWWKLVNKVRKNVTLVTESDHSVCQNLETYVGDILECETHR